MEAVRAGFPMDWLADAAAPASDVELALLLVNSHDLLEEQPDRLVDLTWLTRAFTAAGHGDCAGELSQRDLPASAACATTSGGSSSRTTSRRSRQC